MISDTIQQELLALPSDAGSKQLQHKVQQVRSAGRKLVLASVGLVAYVADGAAAVVQSTTRAFSSAERRGQRMSREVTRRFSDIEEQAVTEMRKLQEQVDENVDHLRSGMSDREYGEDELEKRVELVLANLGFPSRERLQKLSQEIDDLNSKIDQQLMRLPSQSYPEPLA